ncbi:DUF3644 domain-containing protein [Jannaschia sp. CCS1]|uniref:DUF3644 domain-containing protein n=1 Tax=Jannaschia sp. (strain CCS1) TaxID=290400 RepID=UPI000053ACBB|nr:DUF3644 domain-containing protein [Jannaschia sp. CCS1]ABD56143.1 hypothetical protein Jann_3226 [Jannaschia sp. CCS1]
MDEKPKVKRRRGKKLERWEVAIVKAMIARGGLQDQDIQSYFTRPSRTINHARIKEIRDETKHKAVKPADDETLDAFLGTWPDVDPDTGLSLRGDELLIKAREAMIAAVHVFNSAGLTFRAELFIVTSIIAWTYLLDAWFKREGIDYHYPGQTTAGGADKYWELGKCLKHAKCPVQAGGIKNLEMLLELRHEIEHRSTNRIDDALGAKLQACAINFNAVLKAEFGAQHGLEKRLPIALQFVAFGADQRTILKRASDLPVHLAGVIDAFEYGLTEDQLKDPAYRFKVGFLPVAAKKPGAADAAVEIVSPGSEDAAEIERIIFKDRERNR